MSIAKTEKRQSHAGLNGNVHAQKIAPKLLTIQRAQEEEKAAEEYADWRATLMEQVNNKSVTMADLFAPDDEILHIN